MKNPKKVFIVEDSKIETLRIKKIIEEDNNLQSILYFSNGFIAIQKLTKIIENDDELPDFIVLDLNMPVMNGLEFISEITKSEKLKTIPIFINSSTINLSEYHQLKKHNNVKGIFIKPFSMMDLNTIYLTIKMA